MHRPAALAALLFASGTTLAQSAPPAPGADELEFRATYQELVETDTTLSTGNCTAAAARMAARLRAAGLPDGDIEVFGADEHPREGGLFAVLRGRSRTAPAVLLVAHIDVVEVRAADWQHPPFRLVEEAGYFYGRGVSDNKAMAAALVDSLVRLRKAGLRPRRDVKIALTCGEETATAFNGAAFLAQQRRGQIAAGFAIVPSGGARLDAAGRPVSISIQAGEKIQQNFELVVTHAGGHSSKPVPDGAVARFARSLARLTEYQFPIVMSEPVRRQLSLLVPQESGARRATLEALAARPDDPAALAAVAAADAGWNALLRTTCTPTLLEAGEAINTLPQRARATINCRLLPGGDVDDVRRTLVRVIGDPTVVLTLLGPASPTPPAPPLLDAVIGPVTLIAAQIWPGVAVTPTMLTGATDARHLNAAGIPTYGLTAVFNDPDGNGVHAQNERVRTRSVHDGREFLYRLIRAWAETGSR